MSEFFDRACQQLIRDLERGHRSDALTSPRYILVRGDGQMSGSQMVLDPRLNRPAMNSTVPSRRTYRRKVTLIAEAFDCRGADANLDRCLRTCEEFGWMGCHRYFVSSVACAVIGGG